LQAQGAEKMFKNVFSLCFLFDPLSDFRMCTQIPVFGARRWILYLPATVRAAKEKTGDSKWKVSSFRRNQKKMTMNSC